MDMDKHIKRFLERKCVKLILGDAYQLSEIQHKRLTKLFQKYGSPRQMEGMLSTIAYFVKVDLTNYTGRYRRLKGIPGTSKYSQMLRYGTAYKEIYEAQTARKTRHLPNRLEYWKNTGYNDEEARSMVHSIQLERGKKAALKLSGSSLYTVRSLEHWLHRGFSKEQAVEMVRNIQITNGLDWYIRKYGDRGIDLFNKRIEKWKNSIGALDQQHLNLCRGHSIEARVARGTPKDIAVRDYELMCNKLREMRRLPSKISQKFCDLLDARLDRTCFYATKNYEKLISGFRVDLYHPETQTVIEYYGDFHHRNPTLYSAEFVAHGQSSADRWDYDAVRKQKILDSPWCSQFLVVWDSDFRKNPSKTVEDILKEIK